MAQITGSINLNTADETTLLAEVNLQRTAVGQPIFANADDWADWILGQASSSYISTSKEKSADTIKQVYKVASQAQKDAAWAALGMSGPAPVAAKK